MAKTAKKEERNLWERQEKESAQAYEAFCIYRDTKPSDRSKRDVARQLSKNESLIYKWSSQHKWDARVLDYDNWIERQAAAAAVDRVVSMRKRHINIAMKMQEVSLKALSNIDPRFMKQNEMRLLLKLALEVEESNRVAEVQHSHPQAAATGPGPPGQNPDPPSSSSDDWISAVLASEYDES